MQDVHLRAAGGDVGTGRAAVADGVQATLRRRRGRPPTTTPWRPVGGWSHRFIYYSGWSAGDGGELTPLAKSFRHVGQGVLGM